MADATTDPTSPQAYIDELLEERAILRDALQQLLDEAIAGGFGTAKAIADANAALNETAV